MTESLSKPVVFLVFANDRDDTIGYLRNLPDEARLLREALEPAERAGLCEVVVRSNATADDVFKVFQDPKYRNRIGIFHYGGHANGYQLLFESAAGRAAAAHAGGLAAFLAQQHGLQLVFLNGCSTQQQTLGLLDANVSVVISTSRSIDDKIATDFAHRFYRALAGGATLRTAFNEAEASAQTTIGSNVRAAYIDDPDADRVALEADRWPWGMTLREGADDADQWNLPEEANAPLFGLPPLPDRDLPETPYRHLKWFTEKDAEVFFGRGHEIRELYDRLTAPRAAPVLLFYGQSGVGKSSLLAAGLFPRLQRDYDVRYVRRNSAGLTRTLRDAVAGNESDKPLGEAWREAEATSGKPLIVFLDQVEELFTRPLDNVSSAAAPAEEETDRPNSIVPHELTELLAELQAAFSDRAGRPRGRLVLGFRKEWLAEIEAQCIDSELPRTRVFLAPLGRRGIVEVVQGPTHSARLREAYGLQVEDGLAQIIADDLLEDRDSPIAPTLQILLTKMWAKAQQADYEQPQFTQALYRQLKRDGILLRDFLDQQIAGIREDYPEAVASGLLLDILAVHTTALGTAGQCTLETLQREYAHLGDVLPKLLQACQDRYLLTMIGSESDDTGSTTRLAHDTLAPLVRERFDESDRPGQRARRVLENRSVDWADEQTGTPLDEPDLAVVEQGRDGMRVFTPDERRLFEASRVESGRKVRLRRVWRAVGAIAVAVVLAFGVVSYQLKVEADRSKIEADNRAEEARAQAYRADLSAYNARLLTVTPTISSDPARVIAELEDARKFDADLRDFAWGFLHRLADRTKLSLTGHTGPVFSVAFSPDGKTLASGSYDNTIRLWDAHTGQERATLTLTGHTNSVESVAFSPDGKTLASGSRDNMIRLWDAHTGQERATLTGHTGWVTSVAFSPDGKTLASGSRDNTIRLWDAHTGQERATLTGHTSTVYFVAFSPDGKTLASGSRDDTIRLWDAHTGQERATLTGHTGWVTSVAFSPDGKTLASGSRDNTIRLWDPHTGQERATLTGHATAATSVAFSPDGKTLAAGSEDNTIRLWDAHTGQERATLTGHTNSVNSVAFSPDGKTLASGSHDSTIRLWDAHTGQERATLTGHTNSVESVAFSPDGKTLASGSRDNTIRLWDAHTGQERATLTGRTEWVSSVAFSPDGKTLASGSGDGTIRLWDAQTGQERATLTGRTEWVSSVAFSPDGKTLASGSDDNTIRLWDAHTGQERATLTGHDDRVTSVAFSPDGQTLAAGSVDKTIRLWDAHTGQERATLTGRTEWVSSVAFSPDGKTLASGSGDGTIRLWDAHTGQERATLTGHANSVISVAFSPDGKTLASGSYDNTIRLWDAHTGQERATLTGHTETVGSVAFSPDGKTLASGSNDRTIRLWGANTGQ